MNILNPSLMEHMPLISILLGFLCIWMITFLILSLRSSSQKALEQEEVFYMADKHFSDPPAIIQPVAVSPAAHIEVPAYQS